MISKKKPHIWERKSGGGCLTFMGLPFFVFGVLGLLAYTGIIHNDKVVNSPIMSFIVATLCLSIGLAIMLVRTGLTIDKDKKEAKEWISLLIPLRVTKFDLEKYDTISLSSNTRKFHGSDTVTISVTIEGKDLPPVFIEGSSVWEQVNKTAKELSDFLSLPVKEQKK